MDGRQQVRAAAPGLRLVAVLLLAWGGPGLRGAWAQTGQAPPPAPPEIGGDAPAGAPDAGSLSDRLDRSGGVIAPADPGVDPDIVRPTPDTGEVTMPVIPPPGTPGGDPDIQLK